MPGSLDKLMLRAETLLFEKKFEKAIKTFKNILKTNPNETIARKSLGIAYFELGKYEDALKNFQKAAELDITDSEIWSYIGKIYLQKMEKEKALWCFNKVYEIDKEIYNNEFQELIGYGIEEKKKKLENEGIIPINPELEPTYIICDKCKEKILIDKNTKFCRKCGAGL